MATGAISFVKYHPENTRIQRFIFTSIVIGMAIFLWEYTIPNANYVDFTKAYYLAGKNILSDPDALYLGKLPEFVNIPIVALLFYPFGLLDEGASVLVFLMLSMVTVLLVCAWIIRVGNYKEWQKWSVIWLFAACGPLMYSVRLGNMTHFLLPLIMVLIRWHKRFPIAAGLAAGLCAIIKLPLLLIGVYFLVRKMWRLAVGFWVIVFSLIASSIALFGLPLHVKWYQEAIGRYSGKVIGAYNVQSVNGFIAHLRVENHLFSWVESPYSWKFELLRIAFILPLVGCTVWYLRRAGAPTSKKSFSLELSAVLCLSILISPISWIHYFALLFIPGAFFLLDEEGAMASSWGRWRRYGLLAAFVCLLPPVFHTLPGASVPDFPIFAVIVRKVLVSHYFYGGVIFLWYCLASRQAAAGGGRGEQILVMADTI